MNSCVSGVQIVQRMFCATFPAGSTILLQNAQPSAEDCMYYLADGQAEVVIMGTADRASKSGGLAGHLFCGSDGVRAGIVLAGACGACCTLAESGLIGGL